MVVSSADPTFTALKNALAITPKTTSELLSLGFNSYRDFAEITPNQLLAKLATVPSINPKNVEAYRRAARRMVWLGTQDDPQEKAERLDCKNLTMKGLKAKGIWIDGFDDLSGNEMEEKFGDTLKNW